MLCHDGRVHAGDGGVVMFTWIFDLLSLILVSGTPGPGVETLEREESPYLDPNG